MDFSNTWPAYDPPISSWFQVGQFRSWPEPDLVFVTLHLSGWLDYSPGRWGLQRMFSRYVPAFRKQAEDKAYALLRKHFGLDADDEEDGIDIQDGDIGAWVANGWQLFPSCVKFTSCLEPAMPK